MEKLYSGVRVRRVNPLTYLSLLCLVVYLFPSYRLKSSYTSVPLIKYNPCNLKYTKIVQILYTSSIHSLNFIPTSQNFTQVTTPIYILNNHIDFCILTYYTLSETHCNLLCPDGKDPFVTTKVPTVSFF